MEVSWASLNNKTHYEKFSQWISGKGFANNFTCAEAQESDFISKIKSLMEKVTSIRIDAPFSDKLAEFLVEFPFEMSFLNFTDYLVKKDGKWWLRSLLNEAVRRLIVTSSVNYEVTGNALVVGEGAAARACVYGLSSLGVHSVDIVSSNVADAKDIIKRLKHHCFKVIFNAIEVEEVKNLPPKYTIVLNTSVVSPENKPLTEASYFNFIMPGAIVLDLSPDSDANFFLKQAKNLKLHCISGEKVQAMKDLIWCEEIFEFSGNLNELAKI